MLRGPTSRAPHLSCPDCGLFNDENSIECAHCGACIDDVYRAAQIEWRKARNRKAFFQGVVFFIAFIVVVTLMSSLFLSFTPESDCSGRYAGVTDCHISVR